MQEDDSAGFDRQVPEGSLQLITAHERIEGVGGYRLLVRQHLRVGHEVALSLRLGVAHAHQQAIRRALELRWVPQATDVTPDVEEGFLCPILSQIGVAQYALGDAEQAVVIGDHERLEGRDVARLYPDHEVLIHAPTSLGRWSGDQRGDRSCSGPPYGTGAAQARICPWLSDSRSTSATAAGAERGRVSPCPTNWGVGAGDATRTRDLPLGLDVQPPCSRQRRYHRH